MIFVSVSMVIESSCIYVSICARLFGLMVIFFLFFFSFDILINDNDYSKKGEIKFES